MNIKLHTPESLKNESGMASWKQFLLSLLATTISIALTFGTAAIIDYKKKQKEKHEIVMMVMYDMYNSMVSIEKADSMIRQSMEIQRQIAEDPAQFDKLRFQLIRMMPLTEYTETTEKIFSTSIETINTVGNVFFTENVAEFYQMRQLYKTSICDSISNDFMLNKPFNSIKGTLNYQYVDYAMLSSSLLKDMKHLYVQCSQMMKITDKEIETYRKKREQMEQSMSEEDEATDSIYELMELQNSIDESKAKLNLE